MYWGDYFRDTRRLSTLEHGAYLLLIGEYWVSGRPLPDDDATLARLAGTSEREWPRIKPNLAPMFTIEKGEWKHERVENELAKARARYDQKVSAGKAGGEAKAKREPSERLADATPEGVAKAKRGSTQPQPHSPNGEIKPNPSGLGKKPTKGTRLGNDWKPDQQDCDFCWQELGWSGSRAHAEGDKFRDYWVANPKGVKLDWRATWRNWCRRSHENAKPVANRPGRATEGERHDALRASVADELVNIGATANGLPESGNGAVGAGDGAITVGYEVIPDADEPPVRQPPVATERELGNLARIAGQVPAGRSETRFGSRLENPQVGNPAEDRADGGSGGNRRELSAQAGSEGHVGEGHHAAGMGQAGSDADLLDIPDFLRRHA